MTGLFSRAEIDVRHCFNGLETSQTVRHTSEKWCFSAPSTMVELVDGASENIQGVSLVRTLSNAVLGRLD